MRGTSTRILPVVLRVLSGGLRFETLVSIALKSRPTRIVRIACCLIGFGGLACTVLNSYAMFSSFTFWKLFLSIMTIPGSAMFLFFAFYRGHQLSASGCGGSSGAAPAPVTWPPPATPPALSAGAAESIPREPGSFEYRGTPAKPTLKRKPGSPSASRPDGNVG
jgi:hypothetical protein